LSLVAGAPHIRSELVIAECVLGGQVLANPLHQNPGLLKISDPGDLGSQISWRGVSWVSQSYQSAGELELKRFHFFVKEELRGW